MGNGMTASNLAEFSIRTGLFALNHSGIYSPSPLPSNHISGSAEGYSKMYSLNNLSNSIRFFNSTLNSLNALYGTYSKKSNLSAQSSLATLTLSLFGAKNIDLSFGYAKYQDSAQRLGLPTSSFNLFGLKYSSLSAKNIYRAISLSSGFNTGSSSTAYQSFLG